MHDWHIPNDRLYKYPVTGTVDLYQSMCFLNAQNHCDLRWLGLCTNRCQRKCLWYLQSHEAFLNWVKSDSTSLPCYLMLIHFTNIRSSIPTSIKVSSSLSRTGDDYDHGHIRKDLWSHYKWSKSFAGTSPTWLETHKGTAVYIILSCDDGNAFKYYDFLLKGMP